MIEPMAQLGGRIGAALMERKQTIAVADGATGGLISAGLLSVAGATAFYLGGGVVYSLRGRDILLDLEQSKLKGMKSVTEAYALLQAAAVRDRFGSDWGIAESGSAGPSHPFSVPAGRSCIAVVGPGCSLTRTIDTGDQGRLANMEAFAMAALSLLDHALSCQPAAGSMHQDRRPAGS